MKKKNEDQQLDTVEEMSPETVEQVKAEEAKQDTADQVLDMLNEPAHQPEPQPEPQQNKATVLYDENGKPVFVQQVQPLNNVPKEESAEKSKKKRKLGVFIASIITLVLALMFTALAVVFFIQFVQDIHDSSPAAGIILFLVYMLTGIGFITFVPGFGLSIASLVCSCFACKSNVKAIKIISGFVLAFSIIALIISIIVPFLLPNVVAFNSSGSGSSSSHT